jgi:transcriptional regulator with XRE-family HTH domain
MGSSTPTDADHAAEAIAVLPAHRLGSLLLARREQAHVDSLSAARAAGIGIAALDVIESGRAAPATTVVLALLERYGVSPAEFVPPRTPVVTARSDATSDEILRSHIDAVRQWRRSGRADKLNFRDSDMRALGKALGTDPDEIEQRLIALTGCSPREARLLRKWLLKALVTIPVAAGLAGGIPASAVAARPAASPSSASGASVTTAIRGTVRAGRLTVDAAAPKLGPVRADGSVPVTVSYVITDARGSGAGWAAQVSFISTDATAYPTGETLDNIDGEANAPQIPTLPASLTSTPAVIAQAAAGTEGMGSFAGQLELTVLGHSVQSSGQLMFTFAPPASS